MYKLLICKVVDLKTPSFKGIITAATLVLCLAGTTLHSQELLLSEKVAIQSQLDLFFTKMKKSDTTGLSTLFLPQATFLTTSDALGTAENLTPKQALPLLYRSWAATKPGNLNEKIFSSSIQVDGHLATVWMDYEFYSDTEFSHCGKNVFTFVKTNTGWRIAHLADTRRREQCPPRKLALTAQLDSLMNRWHHAAAVADEAVFFGFMPDNGIYIGTDATERWLAKEMKVWAAPFFERESAWDFTTISRNFDFSDDLQTAWFDELLDTWMGTCRASGVLQIQADGTWQLAHYHLSIAVPNDKVQEYLKVIGKAKP